MLQMIATGIRAVPVMAPTMMKKVCQVNIFGTDLGECHFNRAQRAIVGDRLLPLLQIYNPGAGAG